MLLVTISPTIRVDVLLGVVYRPETGGMFNLEHICNSINRVNTQNCILTGDFIFRDIDWDSAESNVELSKTFLSTVEDNFLTQLVQEPTRGDNILDSFDRQPGYNRSSDS